VRTDGHAEHREEPSRYSGNAIQISDDTSGTRQRRTRAMTDARRAINDFNLTRGPGWADRSTAEAARLRRSAENTGSDDDGPTTTDWKMAGVLMF